MAKIRIIDNELVVKNLGTKSAFVYALLFLPFTAFCMFLLKIVHESDDVPIAYFIAIYIFVLLLLAPQYLFIKNYIVCKRRVLIFNKKKGSVKTLTGNNHKELFLGRFSHWHLQKIEGGHRGNRVTSYTAVLVGTNDFAVIGLTAFSHKTLTKKLEHINEYTQLGFEFSDEAIKLLDWNDKTEANSCFN